MNTAELGHILLRNVTYIMNTEELIYFLRRNFTSIMNIV